MKDNMVRRKNSNLKASQDANEERRVKLINEALVVLHQEKAIYPDITSLAKRVATMISLQEKISSKGKSISISYTTILRNTRSGNPSPYRLQLEMYQAGTFDQRNINKHVSLKEVEDYIINYPALRMYIAMKDLEITNLKQEIDETHREMKRVKQHLQLQSQSTIQVADTQHKLDQLNQVRQDLALTCTWIERLLRSRELAWIEIDEENEVILNKSKVGSPPIAEKYFLGPFFKAIKIRHQGTGQDED